MSNNGSYNWKAESDKQLQERFKDIKEVIKKGLKEIWQDRIKKKYPIWWWYYGWTMTVSEWLIKIGLKKTGQMFLKITWWEFGDE